MKIKHDDKDIAKVVDSSQRHIRQHGDQGNNSLYRSRRYQEKCCGNCGFEVHLEGNMCPANGKRCNICSRYNHFAAVCGYDRDTHTSTQNSRQPESGY